MTRKTRKPEGGRGATKHTNPAERDASEDTKVGKPVAPFVALAE